VRVDRHGLILLGVAGALDVEHAQPLAIIEPDFDARAGAVGGPGAP